jgi:hypothetical protein
MTRSRFLILLVPLLLTCCASATVVRARGVHAKFENSAGQVIALDGDKLQSPYSGITKLYSCGDSFQECLTNRRDFSFSFFHKCSQAVSENYKRLRFRPRIASALHNNLWIVFDDSPNYMFHYIIPNGLVGIFLGASPSYDFRTVFHDRSFRVGDLDSLEYRIVGTDRVAACAQ